jgi:hypothetical protein
LLPIFAFEIIEKDEIECKGQHNDQHLKGFFEEKQKNRKTHSFRLSRHLFDSAIV